jgi:membrane protease YdiL (CAAX protease family)
MDAYAARGRNEWWRYLLTLALALVISMVLGVGVVAALMLGQVLDAELANKLMTPQDPLIFFPATGVTFCVFLIGFWLAARLIQKKRFGDIAGAWRWSDFAAGAAIWAVVAVVAAAIDYLIAPKGFRITLSAGTPMLALVAFGGLAIQTFTEEWVFRGWVTQGLLRAVREPLYAAIISALIFGAVHIPNGWPQAAGAAVFGLATALIAIRRGGIAFTWGLHLINNLFGAVVVVSQQDVFRGAPGVFTQSTPQLMWWDVAMQTAATAAVAWAVWRRPVKA